MSKLSIVHWNDTYHVRPQKISLKDDGMIDVTQFAVLLDNIRRNWSIRSDGTHDGLSLFSGDLFSPSADSTVTRGSHLVPVVNELAPDVAMTGNHDFDFGYPRLSELLEDIKFPWLLSNITDENTNDVPEHLELFKVLERSGVRVGVIGLVEEDWIATIPAWPSNFKFKDMAKTGRELSQLLRGEHQCDLVVALTHARVSNVTLSFTGQKYSLTLLLQDLQLAKDLLALSPSTQQNHSVTREHGVDIILGGHDHVYFVSKGVTTWEGYDVSHPALEAEGDNGDTLVVKSGTDFRELSEFTLELEDTPEGSVRKKVIKTICGKRHQVQPDMPSSKSLQKILDDVLSSVSKSLNAPVCISGVELDLRSQSIRTGETAAGNWFADVLRHAYDDTLQAKHGSGADGVLLNGGILRADTVYPAGVITLGNILETLPYDDPAVVLELDGESLWDAFEAGLSKYPAHEGRFPIVSGIRVSWDSRLQPGQRVLGIWLLQESSTGGGELIKREKNGRTYKIVMSNYLATGNDGYTVLVGHKYLIDDEEGQIMSTLVRRYLLGASYVNKMVHLHEENQKINHLHSKTADVIRQEIEHRKQHEHQHLPSLEVANASTKMLHQLRPRASYADYYDISAREHMSCVDCYDGTKVRQESGENGKSGDERISREELLVIHPVVDGRMKDEARD